MDKEEKKGPLENPAHEQFCQEYMLDLKSGRAYATVYGKELDSAARSAASRLMDRQDISERIRELKREQMVRTKTTADDILEFMKTALNFNPVDAFDIGQGCFTLDRLRELPEEFQKLITSVKVGKDFEVNVTFVNKEKILDMLSKHHGLQIDRTHHTIEEKSIEQILRESK